MQTTDSDIDILIVDDVADNRRLLERMLKRRGYQVASASGGIEALEMARSLKPSLILLDVAMPGMDGYQVCQTLKADARLSAIPVIFLSAYSEQPDKLRGFQAGGVDFVTKPFHLHEVAARVAAHIELFKQKQENERLRQKEKSYFSRVNELKNSLIHTITHDLKNPLTSIKLSTSMLERLLELDNDSKEAQYLGKIEDDLDRMLIMISKLLNVTTIETNSSVKMKQVVIYDFLQMCAHKISSVLNQNEVSIRLTPHADRSLKSVVDADQVGSVIETVMAELANRIQPGGTMEISYWVVGDEVLVSLSDQALLDFRVAPDADPELPAEGTDPGFGILSAVLERHGGRIWQDLHTGDYRFTFPVLDSQKIEELGVTFSQNRAEKEPLPESGD